MHKIAIISPSYSANISNSQGRSTYSIASGLSLLGYEVSVFTFTPKKDTFKSQQGSITLYFVGGEWTQSKSTSLPFEDITSWNNKIGTLLKDKVFDTIILNTWHGWEAAKRYKLTHDTKIVSIIPFLYN